MLLDMNDTQTVNLSPATWESWLETLCDLPNGAGPAALPLSERPPRAEAMDAYALSAYAEALQSAEVDGELWETYQDLELAGAADDVAAWAEIKAFYLERGAVLVRVVAANVNEEYADEDEEWLFAPEVLERLRLFEYLAATEGREKAVKAGTQTQS